MLYHVITGHRILPEAEDEDALEEMMIDHGVLPDSSVIADARARELIGQLIDAAPKWDGVELERNFEPPTQEQIEAQVRTMRQLIPNGIFHFGGLTYMPETPQRYSLGNPGTLFRDL